MVRSLVLTGLLIIGSASAWAQNLLTNPGFDGDLSGWTTISGAFSFSTEDATGGAPGSAEGSSGIEFGAFLGQCLEVEDLSTHQVGGMFRRTAGTADMAEFEIFFYTSDDCSGSSLDNVFLSGPMGSAWAPFDDSFQTPFGAASINFWVGIPGGNSTFRMDDLFVIVDPFADGFISGDTTAWSGELGYIGCAHNYCTPGAPLDSTCDDCVSAICADDPFCCTTDWDALCVAAISTVCGETCSLTHCAHDVCQTGDTLIASCDPCATDICAADPFCCTDNWDSLCVASVESICGLSCTYLSCAHSICLAGGPLDSGCDTCVADICTADPFCCDVAWDGKCTAAVATVCGGTCP